MANNKKHLDLNLEFLNKNEGVESMGDTKEEKKIKSEEEAQNVKFFKYMVLVVVVVFIFFSMLTFFK